VELRALVRDGPVAIMCAEAVPWRCHRSLIADALFARGVVVEHIVGKSRTHPHRLTPFAVRDGRRVAYPPKADESASDALPLATSAARAEPGVALGRGARGQKS
ncbi:MAG TPA: DUF488 family protein, partial [Thermoleophilia bacterium]|nr:DUF488 family protein [Thermoleophilia bacterium]